MGFLDKVNNSSQKEGVRIIFCGGEKIGKTTICAQAPEPLFIPLEVGYSGVNVPKVPMIQNYDDLVTLFDEIKQQLTNKSFKFKTLVFDSVTALERLIHEKIVKMDPNYNPGNKKTVTIDSALGGYGKGHLFANDLFSQFLKTCDQFAVYAKLNIVMTCHVFASKIIDPTSGEYDCWDLLLHSPKNLKSYGKREILTQWADVIGFLYEPFYINKQENVTMGISKNQGRVLGLSRTPSYVAGNRFGVEGEINITKENGWEELRKTILNSSQIDINK